MDFGLFPPEVNSGLMYTGPGSGPMLAAAAAWDAVAAELEFTANGYSSVVSDLAGLAWFGPSSISMTAAVTPYVEWLHASAATAQQAAAQAYGAAAAYEAAFVMTVPPPVIAANRAQLMALIATNFFGQNAPAIAATEAQYMQMWVQDSTAMYVYAADSSTFSTLTPFGEPPQTTKPGGQGAQARAVAQTVGNTTSARIQSMVQLSTTTTSHQLTATNTTAQQLSSTNATAHTVNSASVGTVTPVEPGQVATAPPGSTITLGPGTFLAVNSGSVTATTAGTEVATFGSIIVNPGSAVVTLTNALEGGVLIPVNTTVTAGLTPITLSPVAGSQVIVGLVGGTATWTTSTGSFSIVDSVGNTAILAVGAAGASITNLGGTVTINVTPVVPSALGPAAAAVSTSPGLTGTAGIQPQLDAGELAEWARRVSAVDLPADVAGAAG